MKFLALLALGMLSPPQAEVSQVLKEFSTEYNRFSADIYRELLKVNSGNFLVSPLSVEIVLALASSGARGQTAKELTEALHLPDSSQRVNEIFATLAPSLQSDDKYKLSSANKVYVKEGFEISDIFQSTTVDVFKAEIQNIEFEKKEEAAKEINKWIEEKSHETIRSLIQPQYLDEYTRAVLINAIYFHGNWANPFDEEATLKKPFYLSANNSVDTDTMSTFGDYRYYESSELNAQFLELPYAGGDVSMHIVLPYEKDGLSSLEARIEDVLSPPLYSNEDVIVTLPKFKIESSIEFKSILKELGVTLAFEDEADFSGIGAHQENLTISSVIQKVFIEVEEKGTTAAAASAVIIPVPPSASEIRIPKKFFADHPFIFYLRLNKLDINLFVGTFKSPQN